MQKSRIIITLLLDICPAAAARGSDQLRIKTEAEVGAEAAANVARLNYNLVASHLQYVCVCVCMNLIMDLHVHMYVSGCPLTSSHCKKLPLFSFVFHFSSAANDLFFFFFFAVVFEYLR